LSFHELRGKGGEKNLDFAATPRRGDLEHGREKREGLCKKATLAFIKGRGGERKESGTGCVLKGGKERRRKKEKEDEYQAWSVAEGGKKRFRIIRGEGREKSNKEKKAAAIPTH